MSSAVWSTPANAMLDFPAVTLVRFFKNHGFLGLDTQHPWRTVTGGSWQYRDKLIAPFRNRIHVSKPAVQVRRRQEAAQVVDATGDSRSYDVVILACHADEALALLATPTADERRLLAPFHYQKNIATLHTDSLVMPKTRSAWSSWNYRYEITAQKKRVASTIYWMNSLQNVSPTENYFVSINDPDRVDPDKVLKTITYTHPIYSVEAIRAQKELPTLNAKGTLRYCGSYFRYGFHEDALMSAMDLCKGLV